MKKQYNLEEIFEFEVGTKFKCEYGEFMLVVLGDVYKHLAPVDKDGCCSLSDKWIKTKFELIEEWKEVSFIEAMNDYDLRKVIMCETKECTRKFDFNNKDLQQITDIGNDEEFMYMLFYGRWFVQVEIRKGDINEY